MGSQRERERACAYILYHNGWPHLHLVALCWTSPPRPCTWHSGPGTQRDVTEKCGFHEDQTVRSRKNDGSNYEIYGN